jgi:hypothetical protein
MVLSSALGSFGSYSVGPMSLRTYLTTFCAWLQMAGSTLGPSGVRRVGRKGLESRSKVDAQLHTPLA